MDTPRPAKRKMGRPRKSWSDRRRAIGLTVPPALDDVIREAAESRGLSLTDHIGEILAEHHGMRWVSSSVDYRNNQQEELSLTA